MKTAVRKVSSYVRSHGIAFTALFLALGGGAYAAGSSGLVSGSGAITGCVKSHGGPLRIVKAGGKCPKHTVALTFAAHGRNGANGSNGSNGSRGPQGPTGPRGATGATGTPGVSASAGPTILTAPPGWAPTSTSDFLFSSISTEWDEYYNENASLTETFRTEPLTLAQLAGTGAQLKSFSFCYGVNPSSGSKITTVEVDEITQPSTLSAKGTGSAPGGSTSTALIKSTTALTSQGCPVYTPSTTVTLSASSYLVADVGWSGTNSGGDYVFLGHTAYTFTP